MGSRHASKGGGVKPRTVLLAFLAVIGLIQLWALSAHAPTAGSGSVGEGRDVLEDFDATYAPAIAIRPARPNEISLSPVSPVRFCTRAHAG